MDEQKRLIDEATSRIVNAYQQADRQISNNIPGNQMEDRTKEMVERIKKMTDLQKEILKQKNLLDEQMAALGQEIKNVHSDVEKEKLRVESRSKQAVLSGVDEYAESRKMACISFRLPQNYFQSFFAIQNLLKEQCGFPITDRMLLRSMIALVYENFHDIGILKYILIDRNRTSERCKRAGSMPKKFKKPDEQQNLIK